MLLFTANVCSFLFSNRLISCKFLEYEWLKKSLFFRVLQDGDHLAVACETSTIFYFHHGILTSKKKFEVVHFTGRNKSAAKIEIIDLLKFMRNRNLYRVNYTAPLSVDETVDTALKFLDENTWERYNILSNNCEHFATCCKTGRKYSKQVAIFIDEALKQLIRELGSPLEKPSPLWMKMNDI